MIPDYSNTYFPPPQGASNPFASHAQTYFPPPPDPGSLQALPPPPPASAYGVVSPYMQAQSSHSFASTTANTSQHYNPQLQQPIDSSAQTYPEPPSHPPPSYQHHYATQSHNPFQHMSALPPHQFSSVNPSLPYTKPSRPPTPAFRTHFAAMSLHSTDRIRFLRFPTSLLALIRATIMSAWSRGIQSESHINNAEEFKLKGNPWGLFTDEMKLFANAFGQNGEEQSICSRRLVCCLLAALHTEGWVLTMSTDVSKAQADTDTMIFRHQIPAPMRCEWFSLAFSGVGGNKIKLIDAPKEVSMRIVERLGKGKIQVSCKEHRVPGCYEIRLLGLGWSMMAGEMMKRRGVVLDLMECFEEEGWSVYASVDQKVGTENSGDTDTWHCCRPVGWVKGGPVYHQ
ncbi:hypothetical protein P154DRAFT_518704 [Amniculicola lignicola CBS 123094]|uniref:Uncharacterized protein n=1 Tax=Amniculicola lignicola CBS 123094 TaxID=1392246 RepID=A0A6A5X2A8_9PLEO|nr:hypothetical protein P154DRAFT_518704 [Amniculicola lignicola CBS 123094]